MPCKYVSLSYFLCSYINIHDSFINTFFHWCGENRHYQFPFYLILSVTYRYFGNLKKMSGRVERSYTIKISHVLCMPKWAFRSQCRMSFSSACRAGALCSEVITMVTKLSSRVRDSSDILSVIPALVNFVMASQVNVSCPRLSSTPPALPCASSGPTM